MEEEEGPGPAGPRHPAWSRLVGQEKLPLSGSLSNPEVSAQPRQGPASGQSGASGRGALGPRFSFGGPRFSSSGEASSLVPSSSLASGRDSAQSSVSCFYQGPSIDDDLSNPFDDLMDSSAPPPNAPHGQPLQASECGGGGESGTLEPPRPRTPQPEITVSPIDKFPPYLIHQGCSGAERESGGGGLSASGPGAFLSHSTPESRKSSCESTNIAAHSSQDQGDPDLDRLIDRMLEIQSEGGGAEEEGAAEMSGGGDFWAQASYRHAYHPHSLPQQPPPPHPHPQHPFSCKLAQQAGGEEKPVGLGGSEEAGGSQWPPQHAAFPPASLPHHIRAHGEVKGSPSSTGNATPEFLLSPVEGQGHGLHSHPHHDDSGNDSRKSSGSSYGLNEYHQQQQYAGGSSGEAKSGGAPGDMIFFNPGGGLNPPSITYYPPPSIYSAAAAAAAASSPFLLEPGRSKAPSLAAHRDVLRAISSPEMDYPPTHLFLSPGHPVPPSLSMPQLPQMAGQVSAASLDYVAELGDPLSPSNSSRRSSTNSQRRQSYGASSTTSHGETPSPGTSQDLYFLSGAGAAGRAGSGELKLCAVCGDSASCAHYGVRTCEGCKGFFKRTVQKGSSYVCMQDKACPINKRTRNRCQYCRYQKCIAVGMVKEVVRAGSLRGRRGRLPSKTKSQMSEEPPSPPVPLVTSLARAYTDTRRTSQGLAESWQALSVEQVSELMSSSVGEIRRWAERVPGFAELPGPDRESLLAASFLSLLSLRLAFRSMDAAKEGRLVFESGQAYAVQQFPGAWAKFAAAVATEAVALREQLDLDVPVFGCLSALALFQADEQLQLMDRPRLDHIRSTIINALKDHCGSSPTAQRLPQYFARLLALLQSLPLSLVPLAHQAIAEAAGHVQPQPQPHSTVQTHAPQHSSAQLQQHPQGLLIQPTTVSNSPSS